MMKITRYLWINNLPKHCEEDEIRQTFQSHGKIQNIRIHENKKSRAAIVAFIDCKSSTKAFESVKSIKDVPLKLEYCEANGEPWINSLGISNNDSKNSLKKNDCCNTADDSTGKSIRSRSSSSNTSSFGSSLDDCSKYPEIGETKKLEDTLTGFKTECTKVNGDNGDFTDDQKSCLNKEFRGLLVENLSQRSSDTSLREGLFHEYKKHGKITSVSILGQGTGRYAIISFKRSEDMEKAFESSQSKVFFGNQIKVKKHHGFNYIDPDLCPPEHAMDEYHPKATKTLFVGKLTTGTVTEAELKKIFKKYGEIIDIDMKTQSNQPDTSFAFVQYYDISSVVRALRSQDNIKIDGKQVKLGFGKSQPTNCLWVGNLSQRQVTESFLRRHFRRYGQIQLVIPDSEYFCALVQFDCIEDAQRAMQETRDRSNNNNNSNSSNNNNNNNNNNRNKMQVDFASNEYQVAFMNRLKKSCQFDSTEFLKNYADPYQTEKIQNLLISCSKYLGLLDDSHKPYDRYDTKSDYEEYDDPYQGRSSRHRKSVHQRLYGDSYDREDDYSDDYHYTKQNSRHYDDYSPSRSPVHYSRSGQKFVAEQYNESHPRRSNYHRYDYYDTKHGPSSNNHYYRRSPDQDYMSNHNRSYSPSPTSSIDYLDDHNRYNLSPKRYSRKDYRSSRSRPIDIYDSRNIHYDRTSEQRSLNKPYRYDDFLSFRSKSGSRSRFSDSLSPFSRTSPPLRHRARKGLIDDYSISSTSKYSHLSKNNSHSNSKSSTSNVKIKNNVSSGICSSNDIAKADNSSCDNLQSVDTLSKLERERAKLLQELSLLGEESSTSLVSVTTKPPIKSTSKDRDVDANKPKKPLNNISDSNTSFKITSPKDAKPVIACPDITVLKSEPVEYVVENVSRDSKETSKKPLSIEVVSSFPTFHKDVITSSQMTVEFHSPMSNIKESRPVSCSIEPPVVTSEISKQSLDSHHSWQTPELPTSSDCANSHLSRDPRLFSSSYHLRQLSTNFSTQGLDLCLSLPIITSAPITTVATSPATPTPSTSNYKDSTSDSDGDHLSMESELDKRIRELDAKLNRSEQTVRTLDYSKFRIRKRNQETGNLTSNSSSSSALLSPTSSTNIMGSSMTTSSNLLDVGYTTTSRDLSSNTSEFIKTMLNQTKPKNYHLLCDSNSDHLSSSLNTNYSSVVSTTSTSLSFRTVDLGASEIERRSILSKYSSIPTTPLTIFDTKVSIEPEYVSPTISTYSTRMNSVTNCTSSSKSVTSITCSPTSLVTTTSVPTTPTLLSEPNQPVKSILKKSALPLPNNTNTTTIINNTVNSTKVLTKSADISLMGKYKSSSSQDSILITATTESAVSVVSNVKSQNSKKALINSNPLKRKSQSESDDSDFKSIKKVKLENGPTLDDTLFQSCSANVSVKKMKKSSKNLTLSSVYKTEEKLHSQANVMTTPSKKTSTEVFSKSNGSNHQSKINDKPLVSKKSDKSNQIAKSNQKSSNKLYKDSKKSKTKLPINKKAKLKSKSKGILKTVHVSTTAKKKKSQQASTSNGGKHGKVKKVTKKSKLKDFSDDYETNDDNSDIDDLYNDDEEDDDDNDDEFDKMSGSMNNVNYESMYDKIKRRNNKSRRKRQDDDDFRKMHMSKKRRSKYLVSSMNSEGMDSEDSDYWVAKSEKKSNLSKRKRSRLSDLSSSHFSDSNSCKTTPCGKSIEQQYIAEYSELKSDALHSNFYDLKVSEEISKEESITDESKAPAESFNLSSPHNSSQCSSPKFSKENAPGSKDLFEVNNISSPSSFNKSVYGGKVLHRSIDGPLKKRPIAESVVLSEDLPYLEKQPEEEFIPSSPTSINEEPPSQLESIYDAPPSQQANVLEEIVLDDNHHSLDVVEIEYDANEMVIDHSNEEVEHPLPADVNSASHILMNMKSQPNIESRGEACESDIQIQSVAEHLLSLSQNHMANTAVAVVEDTGSSSESYDNKTVYSTPAQEINSTSGEVGSNNLNVVKPKEDEVTMYVKNIIDRIKQETDVSNSISKDRLACKRIKKANNFSLPLTKSGGVLSQSIDCRHLLPVELDSTQGRLTNSVATFSNTQPVSLTMLPQNCLFLSANSVPEQLVQTVNKPSIPLKSSSSISDDKRSLSEETGSTSSNGRRSRHNSARSDIQLQSLDETIDNVVKSSMSSSASDVVSTKSTNDGEGMDDLKSGSLEVGSNKAGNDISSLEETINEVIYKMSSSSSCISIGSVITTQATSSQQQLQLQTGPIISENESYKVITGTSSKVSATTQDIKKKVIQSAANTNNNNNIKQSVYQIAGNMGGIANLVLGFPSILTVNTLVSQQNSMNPMVNFSNSVAGQGKVPQQLTLPINKIAVTAIPTTSINSSAVISNIAITQSNINFQNIQSQCQNQTSSVNVPTTEVVLTKLNSLTPIVIQTPIRNVTPVAQSSGVPSPSIVSRSLSNPICGGTSVNSIALASNVTNPSNPESIPTAAKLVNVSFTTSLNKSITTPINVVPRSPISTTGLNFSKITPNLDALNYIMMQRQANQKAKPTSNESNIPSLNSHPMTNPPQSIILSQLTNPNTVLSPITPGYLTAPMNRSSSNSVPSSSLPTTNGINNNIRNSTPVLLGTINIPFIKFDEKDDWLKQNKDLDFNYPVRWTGKLCLKNDEVFVQMHILAGNEELIRSSMSRISSGQSQSQQPLRIVQRMRLEPNQLEGLQWRLNRQVEFCTCLTLAGGENSEELSRTSTVLNDNFIKYLQEKSAAGIINICVPESQQNGYVMHIFPPCEFSDNQLKICSSKLYEKLKEHSVPYLVIVITTV